MSFRYLISVCVSHSFVSNSLRPHGAHQAPLSMGFLQARILAWVALPFSRGSSQPRVSWDRTQVSCIAGTFFTGPPEKRHVLTHSPSPQMSSLPEFSISVDGTITLPVAQGNSYFPLTLYNQSLESGPHLLVQINMFIFQISYLSHSLPRVLCSSMAVFCSLSLITVTRKMTTFV